MTELLGQIMAQVLWILALSTKEMTRSWSSKRDWLMYPRRLTMVQRSF